MIPDFKTYIRESLWSDMQDRNGMMKVRKEDDVDLMGFEEFANYIKDNYIKVYKDMRLQALEHKLSIPLIKDEQYDNLIAYYKTDENKPYTIRLYIYPSRNIKSIIQKIKEKFHLTVKTSTNSLIEYEVSKKDKSELTNSFVLEIIDFVEDNLRPPYERILIKK